MKLYMYHIEKQKCISIYILQVWSLPHTPPFHQYSVSPRISTVATRSSLWQKGPYPFVHITAFLRLFPTVVEFNINTKKGMIPYTARTDCKLNSWMTYWCDLMIAMLNCKIRRIRVIITKDPSQQLTAILLQISTAAAAKLYTGGCTLKKH